VFLFESSSHFNSSLLSQVPGLFARQRRGIKCAPRHGDPYLDDNRRGGLARRESWGRGRWQFDSCWERGETGRIHY
jgi:hypothetical protein